MFAKLLKHEWKYSKKILTILSIAALGVGVVGAIVLRLLVNNFNSILDEGFEELLMAALIPLLLFLMLALAAYAIGTELLLLYRFYKSKFTDEGYLTFTLPVTSREIFLASFLNMIIWLVIAALVVFASFCLMILFGTAETGLVNYEAIESIVEMFWEMTGESLLTVLINLLHMLFSLAYGLVMAMTCVTIGAVIAKKHKILAAFGIYYVISMISGVIYSVASFAVVITGAAGGGDYSFIASYLCQILMQMVMIAGGFFLSTYLMEKKLNLP